MMGYGYGMGAGMWVIWLLLIAVIALVIFLVVRASGGGTSTPGEAQRRPGGRPSAREILDARYARGEIATEEYEERLSHLVGE